MLENLPQFKAQILSEKHKKMLMEENTCPSCGSNKLHVIQRSDIEKEQCKIDIFPIRCLECGKLYLM